MRITAQFSDSLMEQFDGRAIGDEFLITANARIIGAEEALVDVTAYGESDPTFVQGDLEVKLLLSQARVQG